jgi:5-(carboxyamino)imidazole ribonucleotide synthase
MMAAPPRRVGILGGGQLGRIRGDAGIGHGLRTHIFTPEDHSPAAQVADAVTIGEYTDAE